MKPTQTEIERFILAYHPNECVLLKYDTSTIYSPHEALEIYYHFPKEIDLIDFIEYIELRSIDSLTDKEARHALYLLDVQNFGSGIENKEWVKQAFIDNTWSHKTNSVAKCLDYLRSIGIAVPFGGYTVEQLLESGILKIKG